MRKITVVHRKCLVGVYLLNFRKLCWQSRNIRKQQAKITSRPKLLCINDAKQTCVEDSARVLSE